MELLNKLQPILKDITFDTRAVFTGIFRGEEPISIYSTLGNKEKTISQLTGLLVRKALISSEDVLESFKPEFLFAEGKDFGIFIYVAEDNIAIATVINEKPNFSLLKMTHENAVKKLIPYIEEIKEFIPEPEEAPLKEVKPEEEKPKETTEEIKEKVAEATEEPSEVSEIEELEKILSEEANEVELEKTEEETVQQTQEKPVKEEKSEKIEEAEEKEEITEEVPLEELLGVSKEESKKDTSVEEVKEIDKLIEEIKKKFIKEIGPVGKILFNKILKSINVEENPTMDKLKELIEQLAQEISVEKRRAEFIRDTKKIIGG